MMLLALVSIAFAKETNLLPVLFLSSTCYFYLLLISAFHPQFIYSLPFHSVLKPLHLHIINNSGGVYSNSFLLYRIH